MIDQMAFQQMMANQQNMQAFQQQFQAFQQQFQGMNPANARQMVMQKLQSGAMSQDDFNRCSMMANQLMGRNF